MSARGRSNLPTFEQLRRSLRLANELREFAHGSDRQRMHLLDGLCELVGAQVGLWVTATGIDTGRVILTNALDRGWSGAHERSIFWRFCQAKSDLNDDPSMRPLAEKTRSLVTLVREELVPDDVWYRSAHVQEERRAARVDSFIYASVRLSPTEARCISLHRPWGAAPFSDRERRLIDVFQREHRWLDEPPRALRPALLHGLTPRLGQTLEALARGSSEKQVAAELGLSPHTVHEYVKALYRHFAVSSRSELLARCLSARAAD